MRIENSATTLEIVLPPPGLRAPIVMQLVGVSLAACISLYWLREYTYWVLGFGLYFIYQGAKAFGLSYRPTTIRVEDGVLRVTTSGWLGYQSVEFELRPDLAFTVEKVGERMQVEFFPMHELLIRADDGHTAVVRGHDPATLDVVRRELVEWLRRQMPKA